MSMTEFWEELPVTSEALQRRIMTEFERQVICEAWQRVEKELGRIPASAVNSVVAQADCCAWHATPYPLKAQMAYDAMYATVEEN